MEKEEMKINYLTAAIADAQELIRFTDNKAAIVITVLGAYVIGTYTTLDKIVGYWYMLPCALWFFLIIFLALLLMCVVITARIIRPTKMPISNINISDEDIPILNFYLAPNSYGMFWKFRNSSEHKLVTDYTTYYNHIDGADEDMIIKSLTVELMKVSYLRNIKIDRFNALLWYIIATTIAFSIFYVIYLHQVQMINHYISHLKT